MADTSTWTKCLSCTAAAARREDYTPGDTMHEPSGKCSLCDVLRCRDCHAPVQDIRTWTCPACAKPIRR